MTKLKAAIVGSGNIGTDLMVKLGRSEYLELTAVIGIDPESDGLRRAREAGYAGIDTGIDGFLADTNLEANIIFDATSAKAHIYNNKVCQERGIKMIDLTPAAVGPYVSPAVNIGEHLNKSNINMITCGGQATIPMVHAINRVANVVYGEIVATISSKSAGPGTRANIDEFTETTSKAIEVVGGADKGKAIIILNPAEPPIMMRNTVYALVEEGKMDEQAIRESIAEMEKTVQSYVPGYHLRTEPIFEDNKVTVLIEVRGAGDYLPEYSGNLDIMTSAAVRVAEEFAKNTLKETDRVV
ncbi:acetaldehyde dehydrogenase (acetylating) [Bacillus sp. EB600]|uniref:acetaldehyde dehydrogenase (acetylating) n=1 Tax=Bacillus sp. EB600 TaxID=2806345 RepID=UPI00210CAE81|nr:acetaldehyde dehydrogenase (acetylating) [Bacillus sp. EB600]MCQ6282680.1 acetaldehyde dehydrogenase (acetylating) [Bacillus sp. EB600]